MTAIPLGYVKDAERFVELARQWISDFNGLPDLRFYNPGHIAVIGPLDAEHIPLLAASEDATKLLLWCDEQGGHRATLLIAICGLERMGLLEGAEPLTPERIESVCKGPLWVMRKPG